MDSFALIAAGRACVGNVRLSVSVCGGIRVISHLSSRKEHCREQ